MLRRSSAYAWVLGAGALVAVASWACGSSSPAVGLAQGCAINSDCNSPLVCAFGLCHEACTVDRDCPDNELCVPDPNGGSDFVCQLPAESVCSASLPCATEFTCSADHTCRVPCSASKQCNSSQTCNSDGLCYDSSSLDGGTSDGAIADGGADTSTDAGVDAASVDAGILGFLPSNFDPNGPPNVYVNDAGTDAGTVAIDFTGAPDVVISSQSCGYNCLPAPYGVVKQSDGSLATLYVMNTFTLLSNQKLNLNLENENPDNVIIFAVHGDVSIQGALTLGADEFDQGPGSYPGNNTAVHGPGAGAAGAPSAIYPNSGSGGASFCGLGGNGGTTAGTQAPAGNAYGTADLIPLLPGSTGGTADQNGGAGGGGIQISSGTSIFIGNVGYIISGGGAGANGGGGSGGGILLEAPSITISGAVVANGAPGGDRGATLTGVNASIPNATPTTVPGCPTCGIGSGGTTLNGTDGLTCDAGNCYGSGGGGAGRIRFNTSDGGITSTGVVSPSLGTVCATQGVLKL